MNKLLIKIPTRERGFDWLPSYLDNITNPNTMVLLTLDLDEQDIKTKYLSDNIGFGPHTFVFSESKGKIEAINRDISDFIDDFDILLVGSDDMIPQVKGFDQIILDDMNTHYPDGDGCLWYHTEDHEDELKKRNRGRLIAPGSPDFYRKWICMMPIMGKAYYKRFNYVYHDSYKSFSCDDEYTIVAHRLGKIKYIHRRIIKHFHPAWEADNSFGKPDDLYKRNDPNFGRDRNNLSRRTSRGFPQ